MKERWDEAVTACEAAKRIDGAYPTLKETCAAAEAGQLKGKFPWFVAAANRQAQEQEECVDADKLAENYRNLKRIPAGDPNYKAAVAAAKKLEGCRKQIRKFLLEGVAGVMRTQRETWARQYERELLGKGVDVVVTLSGKQKDAVKIRWVLLSRSGVYQITRDGEFLGALRNMGFRKVTFTDGYFESWRYDLEPETVEAAVVAVLAADGLDKPLKL